MSLSRPADYSSSALSVALGCGIGICIFLLKQNHSPFSGDSSHALPHGGCYRDGTKQVFYNRPKAGVNPEGLTKSVAFLLCLILPLVIYASSKRNSGGTANCASCNSVHAAGYNRR